MEFTQSATYPLDVDSVIRMSTDPAFLDMRFGRFMAANPEVTVEGDTITYVGTVDPELIPAIARPFTKNGITLTFTESWTRTEEGATAHTEVAVGGAPDEHAVGAGALGAGGRHRSAGTCSASREETRDCLTSSWSGSGTDRWGQERQVPASWRMHDGACGAVTDMSPPGGELVTGPWGGFETGACRAPDGCCQ